MEQKKPMSGAAKALFFIGTLVLADIILTRKSKINLDILTESDLIMLRNELLKLPESKENIEAIQIINEKLNSQKGDCT